MFCTRNTRIFLSAAMMLVLFTGCSREEMLQEERQETVGLSFENDSPGTRVFFREDGSLYFDWVSRNEPAIDVHTSSGAYKSCAVDIDESSVQVPISQGEYRDGFAIYPAGIVQNNSTSSVTISYQSEYHHFGADAPGYAQDFADNDGNINLCYARIPMIAVNTPSEGLVFRHVGGMLSFAVFLGWEDYDMYGSDNYYLDSATGYVTKMTFTVGGDKIAGTATVSNPASANPTATIAPGDGSSTVTVYLDDDHGDIARLGREDLLQDLYFINIPVPCGTYNGLVIRCYDADDNEVCAYADDAVRQIGRGEARTKGWCFDRHWSGHPMFTSFWPDHITITNNGVSDYSGNLLIPMGSTSSVKGTVYTYPINNEYGAPVPAEHPSRITTIAPVKYYSRNTSVVTVNEDTGEITTVAPGTASIYATATYLGHTITSEDYGVNVLGHAFSVAADKQVYFAPGNLAYADGVLSFYAHGYDAFCQLNENRVNGYSSISEDLMDRYTGYIGPSIHSMTELPFPAGFDMFTFKNDVSLPGSWHLLSRSEWAYLINDRNDALKKFCGGYIDFGGNETLCGVIILPDTFVDPMVNQAGTSVDGAFGPSKKNADSQYNTHPSKNIYSVEGWAAMEAAGAIFLPTIPFFNDYDTVYTLTYNYDAGDFFYLLSDGRTAFGNRAGNMAERLEVWATEELPADQSLLFYVRAVYDAQ